MFKNKIFETGSKKILIELLIEKQKNGDTL